jgi:rhodanese-related sulfurtransferase
VAQEIIVLDQIDPSELRRLLDGGEDLVLLDVREPEEVAVASLPQAVHVPMRDVTARLHELNKNRRIVVMCHHGIRSANVAHYLAQHDFRHVTNLAGGIDAWSLTVDPTVPRY